MVGALWAIAVVLAICVAVGVSTLSSELTHIRRTLEDNGKLRPTVNVDTGLAVQAPLGTRLAYLEKRMDGTSGDQFDVKYANVLAFISPTPAYDVLWMNLVLMPPLVSGHGPRFETDLSRDHYVIKLLLPGETLDAKEIDDAVKDFPSWEKFQRQVAEARKEEASISS